MNAANNYPTMTDLIIKPIPVGMSIPWDIIRREIWESLYHLGGLKLWEGMGVLNSSLDQDLHRFVELSESLFFSLITYIATSLHIIDRVSLGFSFN